MGMPSEMKARPPFVTFGHKVEEDREATEKAGHFVGRDVAYAFITPMGSKDRIEKIASEWLAQMKTSALEGKIPAEWVEHFNLVFKHWKEGTQAPVNGTALSSWPPISPAVLETLVAMGIRTVEDLAECNEEAITRAGMGARALKQQAKDWLQSSKENGVFVAEMAKLRATNANLTVRNESLEKRLAALEARVGAGTTAKVEGAAAEVEM